MTIRDFISWPPDGGANSYLPGEAIIRDDNKLVVRTARIMGKGEYLALILMDDERRTTKTASFLEGVSEDDKERIRGLVEGKTIEQIENMIIVASTEDRHL